MNETMIREIANDCAILLRRALWGKSIACFGIDGFGIFGRTDQAQIYPIAEFSIRIDMDNDDDTDFPGTKLELELVGYDAAQYGHVLTDQNFMISLNALLKAEEIGSDIWTWGLAAEQPSNGIILNLDIQKLLQWN
jgi:hypothetical protein